MDQSFELACMNTWFQKSEVHLIIYESGGMKSQIDYILVREAGQKNVMNGKVMLGEACVKQHRLVVIDFEMRSRKPKRRKRRSRIKVCDLNGEKCEQFRKVVREKETVRKVEFRDWTGQRGEKYVDGYEKNICRGTDKLVGRASGYGVSKGEKWWWNGEMQESVKRKSKALKDWNVRLAHGAEERCKEEKKILRRKLV
ncbi:uncharacterized protein [Palaemon carinicauda]|uniref:uncharacterized protein n=1 Tax=Palaemon carinicauda TaxID=392227 RepID=UPI0035B57E75